MTLNDLLFLVLRYLGHNTLLYIFLIQSVDMQTVNFKNQTFILYENILLQ